MRAALGSSTGATFADVDALQHAGGKGYSSRICVCVCRIFACGARSFAAEFPGGRQAGNGARRRLPLCALQRRRHRSSAACVPPAHRPAHPAPCSVFSGRHAFISRAGQRRGGSLKTAPVPALHCRTWCRGAAAPHAWVQPSSCHRCTSSPSHAARSSARSFEVSGWVQPNTVQLVLPQQHHCSSTARARAGRRGGRQSRAESAPRTPPAAPGATDSRGPAAHPECGNRTAKISGCAAAATPPRTPPCQRATL
jgi:hypothetical protein